MTALNPEAARRLVKVALDGLWQGTLAEKAVIDTLRTAYHNLGGDWTPPEPTGDDGGYVPSDDDQPVKLANAVNNRLAGCEYDDGDNILDGPFEIWARAQIWYGDTLLVKCQGSQAYAVVNALLDWGDGQGGKVESGLRPPYPGPSVGWRWGNVELGSQWVVNVWLTHAGVALVSD